MLDQKNYKTEFILRVPKLFFLLNSQLFIFTKILQFFIKKFQSCLNKTSQYIIDTEKCLSNSIQ
jgi:hypothetical protein